MRGLPFVLVVKDIFPDVAIQLGVLRNSSAIRVLRAIKTALFYGADRVVSIGRDMDERLLALGVRQEKIVTIHDWADGEVIRPLDQPSIFRKEQGWEERFVVMHSGNVGLSQDLDTVIGAAALLRDNPTILFTIIGEGASRSRLQEECARRGIDNVAFLPYRAKADLSESLGAADVHLVTLKQGLAGFIVPSKVYGILAAGRPVIAAVDPGSEPDRIVSEFECGFSIPPGDERLLAATVKEATAADLAAMGTRARRALEQRFDRSIAARAYLDLLDGATVGGGRRSRGTLRESEPRPS
jgi:colanic acid biosynthesis glycosyl transferase WcaI